MYDPTDPVGRLLFNVLAMVAEFASDLIRLRTKEGMKVAGPTAVTGTGGPETIDHVVELLAVTAMIYGGDIVTALEDRAGDAVLMGTQPWTDDRGCERVRVQFGSP